jgi:hypothetical protein
VEALRPNHSVLEYPANRRIDLGPYLPPRKRLSGLRFHRPPVEEGQKTEVDLTQTIKEGLNQFLDSQDLRMEFQKNKTTGEVFVRVIQNISGQVVREGPVIFNGKIETVSKGESHGGFEAQQFSS